MTAAQAIRSIYNTHGLTGFYKGITASYYGIAETVIHFVIYEAIKAKLRELKEERTHVINDDSKSTIDFVEYMCAGATSKTIATCFAYPHGKFLHNFLFGFLWYSEHQTVLVNPSLSYLGIYLNC